MKKSSPNKLSIAKPSLRVLPVADLAKVTGGDGGRGPRGPQGPQGRGEHRHAATKRTKYLHLAAGLQY